MGVMFINACLGEHSLCAQALLHHILDRLLGLAEGSVAAAARDLASGWSAFWQELMTPELYQKVVAVCALTLSVLLS